MTTEKAGEEEIDPAGAQGGDGTAPARAHLAARLRTRIADAIEASTRDGHDTVLVPRERWLETARVLQRDEGFIRFIDLTVIDDPAQELRFEVHLLAYSMEEKRWARIKTRTDARLASVTQVYAAAHNYEREAFDLFGVSFDGHPKLTRILLPDGWQGHPLRRDEPLSIEPTDFTVTRDLYRT
jgi:NADH-quinone oxidoreductase subunit C